MLGKLKIDEVKLDREFLKEAARRRQYEYKSDYAGNYSVISQAFDYSCGRRN